MPSAALSPSGALSPLARTLLSSAGEGVLGSATGTDIDAALTWCGEVGRSAPAIGEGETIQLWDILAATAAEDVTVARMLEPHLDALSILRQALADDASLADRLGELGIDESSTWGVFAAEAPSARVQATATAEGWSLSGTKAWCSLANHLSHALMTAWIDDEHRGLFAVDLRASGVRPHDGPWLARGLTDVVSAPVDFAGARAVAVGGPGWYLSRPGFAWGGLSVAACWWGGAVGIARALEKPARSARADQLAQVHLGRADAALWVARASLAEAAGIVDAGGLHAAERGTQAAQAKLLAARVRASVADAATRVIAECDAALGPAPLVADAVHARRVADLHLYLRQHHGDRDIARIGRDLVTERD